MKKMKRNRGLSLLLAVVMTLSVLSGGLTAYAAEYYKGIGALEVSKVISSRQE